MKNLKKAMLPWLIIFIGLIILFVLYNDRNEHPNKQHKKAVMPTELHPVVEENKDKLIQLAAEKNIQVIITEALRTIEEQNKLYKRGRANDGAIITNAKGGESFHNYGLAIDFALENEQGQVIWDTSYDGNGNNQSDWLEVVEIAKELGFEWGGDWNGFKDYPHFQMTFGLSIDELKSGARPDKAQAK
ncbi:M15 family metallopeptidase [Virgibacillus proomii]|jgi:peptidoglycan LD-endopeptidase CwlK|uniref:M15 family metallopeptidase n=1 Tax=Virgibacillus proomii TaxID=84407 RepID=UPI0009841AFE|nr:M15 family metallopeptidase [Virgibacillus proomii]